MPTKQCFKCKKIKRLDEFYKHSRMADGHLNKCKICTMKDVKERYYNPDFRQKIVDYEKKRFQTEKRKKYKKLYDLRSKLKHPGKARARNKVAVALRNGRLTKLPCQVCGNLKVEAHHTDYRKYLDVMWLCRKHHMEIEGKIPF